MRWRGGYVRFRADVGVDDECGTAGSVVFQVFVDGVKRFDSAQDDGDVADEAGVGGHDGQERAAAGGDATPATGAPATTPTGPPPGSLRVRDDDHDHRTTTDHDDHASTTTTSTTHHHDHGVAGVRASVSGLTSGVGDERLRSGGA